MSQGVDPTRRALLRGRIRPVTASLPLPWALPWQAFVAGCDRCQACLHACPQQIVVPGEGGFPTVDVQRNHCTFCRACADACPKALFVPATERPWSLIATVSSACLAKQRVFCQSCRDSCEPAALTFSPAPGGIAQPRIDAAACNGCGECVAACPAGAIAIGQPLAESQEING